MTKHNSHPQEHRRHPRRMGAVAKLVGVIGTKTAAVMDRAGDNLGLNDMRLTGNTANLNVIKKDLRQLRNRHGIVYPGHDYELDATRAGALATVKDEYGTTELMALAVSGSTVTGLVVYSKNGEMKSIEAAILPAGANFWDREGKRAERPIRVVANKDMTSKSKTGRQQFLVGSETVPGDRDLDRWSYDLTIGDVGSIKIEASPKSEAPIYVIDAHTLEQQDLSDKGFTRVHALVQRFADAPPMWDPALIGIKETPAQSR